MRILLVSGHTGGYNKCATTGVNEGDLNIELVENIKGILDKYAEVEVYPHERDMYKDLKAGVVLLDLRAFDYIFEVHFNGSDGRGRGTSIFLHTDYNGGVSVEHGILMNMEALGFKLRGEGGFNRKNTLLNMNTAFYAGVDYALIETCFYDNVEDMDRYKVNKHAVAVAIADGIIQGFGLHRNDAVVEPVTPEVEAPKENEEKVLYRVQVGAFSNRDRAEAVLQMLKDLGIDGYIKKG